VRLAVVANPASGGGKGAEHMQFVHSRLTALGIPFVMVVSPGPGKPEGIAREAAAGGADVVAALGGDGMVGMVANGLVDTNAAMAVLPGGSGNDFAHMLGLRDLEGAIRLLAEPRIETIDVGRIESASGVRHFVCVAGMGFDSEVNEIANRIHRLRGKPKYVTAVLRGLMRYRPVRFSIRVDGRDAFDGEAMLVAVGNARSYGGGMNVCPDASLTDGALDVCVVGALSRRGFVAAFPKVFRGTHVSHPAVRMFRGATIRVESDRSFRVYADGDPAGTLPADISVIPRALKVVTAWQTD
jgi:diacylglycerol kinase (ATP)